MSTNVKPVVFPDLTNLISMVETARQEGHDAVADYLESIWLWIDALKGQGLIPDLRPGDEVVVTRRFRYEVPVQ